MATKLVNMQMPKRKSEELTTAAESPAPDTPIYPWGLQVRLDEESLDKLGMDTLPKVDGELMLIAKVKVVGASINEHTSAAKGGKHKHKSVELQITDLCLEAVPAGKDAADELYAKKG